MSFFTHTKKRNTRFTTAILSELEQQSQQRVVNYFDLAVI